MQIMLIAWFQTIRLITFNFNISINYNRFSYIAKKFETNDCSNTIGSYYCRCNPGYEPRYGENALDYFSSKDTTNIDNTWEQMNDGMGRFSTYTSHWSIESYV